MSDKKVVFVTGPAGCGKSANSAKLAEFFNCKTTVDDWGAAAVAHAFKHTEGNVLVLGLPDEPDLLSGLPAGTEIEMHEYYDAAKLAGFSPFHTPDGRLLPGITEAQQPPKYPNSIMSAKWVPNPEADRKYETEVAEVLGEYGHDLRVLNEIKAEREKQRQHGYDASSDDRYTDNELPQAAIAYALNAALPKASVQCPFFWPWTVEAFKPENRRADLIKAAALLVAEIERMDRAIAAKTSVVILDEGWNHWNGCGEKPVPAGTRVDIYMQHDAGEVRQLNGVLPMAESDQEMDIAWKKTVNGNRIVAWRPSAVSVCEFCHGVDNDHAAGCCQGV